MSKKLIQGTLLEKDIRASAKKILSLPEVRIGQNAMAQAPLKDIGTNLDVIHQINFNFSHTVSPIPQATAQKASGRCWIFAACNAIRIPFMRAYKLKEFEFSQSFYFFYDKLEKSNYYLQNMIETAEMPTDSRLIMFLSGSNLLGDGGQMSMFQNLIEKYGIVPQSVYPDNSACISSKEINDFLTKMLRQYAHELRSLAQNKVSTTTLFKRKTEMMNTILRMLIMHMGLPPEKFDWEYQDTKQKYHRIANLTPKTFAEKIVKFPYNEYVTLVNSPRVISPMNSLLTVEYLNNMVDGKPVEYINVEMGVIKDAAIKSIKDNIPVWFGSDVSQFFHRQYGINHHDLFDFKLMYGDGYKLNKAERMNFGESQMTHAMVLTGVNIVEGSSNQWMIENSWGQDTGKKGYYLMSDKWFDEYVYEIAVNKAYLPESVLKILKQKPIVLPAYDPMGSLA